MVRYQHADLYYTTIDTRAVTVPVGVVVVASTAIDLVVAPLTTTLYGSIIPRYKDFLFTSMFYVPPLAMAVGSGNCCLKCRATLFIDRRGARIGCH